MAKDRLPEWNDVLKWFDKELPCDQGSMKTAFADVRRFGSQHRRSTVDGKFSLKDSQAAVPILDSEPEAQAVYLLLALGWNARLPNLASKPMRALVNQLLRRKLPLTEPQVTAMLAIASRTSYWGVPAKGILRALESYSSWEESTPALTKAIRRFRKQVNKWSKYTRVEELLERLDAVLEQRPKSLGIEPGEAWTGQVQRDLDRMDAQSRFAWRRLLLHAQTPVGASPTTKWFEAARQRIEPLTIEGFQQQVTEWFQQVGPSGPIVTTVDSGEVPRQQIISDQNARVLRGLVWMCSFDPTPQVARAVFQLATTCYGKVPRRGERCRVVANACARTLAAMPSEIGGPWLRGLGVYAYTENSKRFIASLQEPL